MKPKFTEGDIVRETQFKKIHMVRNILTLSRSTLYGVLNISGPGACEGYQIFEEKYLKKIEG